MNTPDAFVFTPTYQINGVDQIHIRTLESIHDMRGDYEFHLGRYNPTNVKHINILNQYRTGRQLFLRSSCEYFMTIEHDMIVPPDALELMREVDADVVYGIYLFRHGNYHINAYRMTNVGAPDQSLSLYPVDLARARAQVTPLVSGAGFGCMLVRRHVLEELDFHGRAGVDSCIPDVEFAHDCIKRGFVQRAHFAVQCGHIEPSGNVLYPFKEIEHMTSNVKVLQSVIVDVNGTSVALKAGKELKLPEEIAEELERAGYVAIDKPKRKPTTRRKSTKSVAPKKRGE